MKTITPTEVLNLLQAQKVVDVTSKHCINKQYNAVWEIDGMLLDNGQFIGIDGDGGGTQYWLAQPQEIKE